MKKPSDASQQHDTKWITIEDFEFICFNTTRELMTYNEPIPDYSTRNNALLESALGSPSQTFDKKLLYPTLVEQAAILFYSLIKNHPFQNGNKRIAVMTLLVFLSMNDKWIQIEPYDLYRIAIAISESKTNEKTFVFSRTRELLKKFIIRFPIKK